MSEYCVLTFRNMMTNQVFKEFVLPNNALSEVVAKYENAEPYHWKLSNVEWGDKEFYLNQKLDEVVKEYNESSKYFDSILETMKESKHSIRVGLDTLECIYENMQSEIKRIGMIMKRMESEDFDIKNEEAHLIYDMFKGGKEI